jgi:hypothetical protein
LLGPIGYKSHIPSIRFDRIAKREAFSNSCANVHEKRFEMIKEPEIWTGIRRIKNIRIDQRGRDQEIERYDSMVYHPNKEFTMQKTAILVPKFELYNKNMDRSTFINICKELRPESYQSEIAKVIEDSSDTDSCKSSSSFNIFEDTKFGNK